MVWFFSLPEWWRPHLYCLPKLWCEAIDLLFHSLLYIWEVPMTSSKSKLVIISLWLLHWAPPAWSYTWWLSLYFARTFINELMMTMLKWFVVLLLLIKLIEVVAHVSHIFFNSFIIYMVPSWWLNSKSKFKSSHLKDSKEEWIIIYKEKMIKSTNKNLTK